MPTVSNTTEQAACLSVPTVSNAVTNLTNATDQAACLWMLSLTNAAAAADFTSEHQTSHVYVPCDNEQLLSDIGTVINVPAEGFEFDRIIGDVIEPAENNRHTAITAPSHEENGDSGNEIPPSLSKRTPARPCPFCSKTLPHLSRHLKTVHKDRDEVKKAWSLPPKYRNRCLCQLKRQGIMQYNKQQLLTQSLQLLRERRRKHNSELAMCTRCNGFFARRHFWRHKMNCRDDSAVDPLALPVDMMKTMSKTLRTLFHKNLEITF